MYTIIVRHHGSDYHYTCGGQNSAIILFDALSRVYTHVEVWRGSTLLQTYDNAA
jgi:hypothetical protein